MSRLREIQVSAARFGTVGIINTAVDFAVTNALFLLLRPQGLAGLTFIAVAAFLAAAANSYFMNARWAFSRTKAQTGVVGRFALATLLGLTISTAIFLFMARHLPMWLELPELVLVNTARLAGVLGAVAVNFASYRLWVFCGREDRPGREPLPGTDPGPRYGFWMAGIVLTGLAARGFFAWKAPVVYGDAVNYSFLAWLIGHGRAAEADTFWHSLFDFWQAGFVIAGLDQYPALLASTLLPGLFVIAIVMDLTRRLYGQTAGIVAGLAAALHPRLVEYSVNGYAEMFFLAGALLAVQGICVLWRKPSDNRAVLAAGVGLSVWLLTRNEAGSFVALAVVVAIISGRGRIRELWLPAMKVAGICLASLLAYAAVNQAIWQNHGLLQKTSNLQRQYVEMIDPAKAARATYGGTASAAENAGGQPLLERWSKNMRYVAERIPGMLLSPFLLAALLLPLVYSARPPEATPTWPVLLFAAWPVALYPLIQLEPRMLFPTVIGLLILASGALVPLGRWLNSLLGTKRKMLVGLAPTALMLAGLTALLPLLAQHSENTRGFHREVGAWIATNLPGSVPLMGDGYGYAATSAFWAGRRALPRVWAEDPVTVADQALANNSAMLIYEDYLRRYNPELLPALDSGLPGLQKAMEFQFPRMGRVQVWVPGTGSSAESDQP